MSSHPTRSLNFNATDVRLLARPAPKAEHIHPSVGAFEWACAWFLGVTERLNWTLEKLYSYTIVWEDGTIAAPEIGGGLKLWLKRTFYSDTYTDCNT